jgi:hypothetical protein
MASSLVNEETHSDKDDASNSSWSQTMREAWPPKEPSTTLYDPTIDALPAKLLGKKLPANFMERLLRDRVRDAVLIDELLVFIPFVLLFLLVSLNVVDIQNSNFAVTALKDLTMERSYPAVGEVNRSWWEASESGETINYGYTDTTWNSIGGPDAVNAWMGMAVQRLYQCGGDELLYRSAAEAHVPDADGYYATSAPPFVNGTSNGTRGNNTYNGTSNTSTPLSTSGGTAAPGLVGLLSNFTGLGDRGWLPPPLRGQLIPVGALRFRAQLVRNDSCTVAENSRGSAFFDATTNTTQEPVSSCYAGKVESDTELRVSPRCYKTDPLNPTGYPMFAYKQCSLIGGIPTTTELGTYHCGGYTYDVPFNLTCTDALRVAYQLMEPSCPFVDVTATRFFVMEYFVYIPQFDAFASVKHVLEQTGGGAWIPSDQFRIFAVLGRTRVTVVVLDFFFLAYVLYYIVRFFVNWRAFYKSEGRFLRYLLGLWALLELVNVTTYVAVFVLRWMWWGYSIQVQARLPLEVYPDDFERLLFTFSSMRYAMAFNFILTFLKMLKFLKISDRLAIVGITFQKAQGDVFGLLSLFIVVNLGYAVAGNTLFGSQMWEFASLDRSFSTLMFMLLGELDYSGMKIVNPSLAGFFFWSYLILSFFLILNFIVAVIGDSFAAAGEEQFVAPMADAIAVTFSNAVWTLRPSTIKLKFGLWRHGKSQMALERQMLGYAVQGIGRLKLKATGVEILVDPQQVFQWFPPALRRDGKPFFCRAWKQFYKDYVLLQETDEEQAKKERRGAVIHGTRIALGHVRPPMTKSITAQLELITALGERITRQLHVTHGTVPEYIPRRTSTAIHSAPTSPVKDLYGDL